jgi:hypothetical protein
MGTKTVQMGNHITTTVYCALMSYKGLKCWNIECPSLKMRTDLNEISLGHCIFENDRKARNYIMHTLS